jgi:hypothetical protein
MPAGKGIGLAAAVMAIAAVPLLTFAAEPEPETGYAWMVNQGASDAAIVYGSTETPEDYSFAMSCNNKRKRSHLTVYEDIAGAKVGQKLTIEIGVGSAKVAIEGKTSTDEMSGYVFGIAEKFAVKPVITVLQESGPGVVKMNKTSVNLPEKGRAEAVTQFANACKLE